MFAYKSTLNNLYSNKNQWLAFGPTIKSSIQSQSFQKIRYTINKHHQYTTCQILSNTVSSLSVNCHSLSLAGDSLVPSWQIEPSRLDGLSRSYSGTWRGTWPTFLVGWGFPLRWTGLETWTRCRMAWWSLRWWTVQRIRELHRAPRTPRSVWTNVRYKHLLEIKLYINYTVQISYIEDRLTFSIDIQ